MNVATLIMILQSLDAQQQQLPITVLADDGTELPLALGRPVVSIEGGGAAPAFVALNVVLPDHLKVAA